ncbi:hypothetical protein IFM89_035500 [Coptis chinensis]|uniref:UBC core domain-containing protein n=1 Tax=Coptis chinensis TaxID=261450 RepID=A0A835HM44_9MAGN|nr:hypothetical protein IFM89_035500 [Coptis chinensis]
MGTPTIFVGVYEERMDLLRAVIIGTPGTPYHDGLFFFDILFPSSYPDVPPQEREFEGFDDDYVIFYIKYSRFYWLSEIRLAFLIGKLMDSIDHFKYNKSMMLVITTKAGASEKENEACAEPMASRKLPHIAPSDLILPGDSSGLHSPLATISKSISILPSPIVMRGPRESPHAEGVVEVTASGVVA